MAWQRDPSRLALTEAYVTALTARCLASLSQWMVTIAEGWLAKDLLLRL